MAFDTAYRYRNPKLPPGRVYAVERIGALGLLDDHAHHCVLGAADEDRADKTDELMAAVGRLMHRG